MGVQEEDGRVAIRRPRGELDPLSSLPADARAGLTDRPKWLRPKYFYDARGSALFERITELPEYYQTRTERTILERVAGDIVRAVRPRAVVEYGSGSASKTRALLDAIEREGRLEGYGAIEVSEAALVESAHALVGRYEGLRFEGVVADFEERVSLPFGDRPRLILFLGSTIGNLTHPEARAFLRNVRAELGADDGFLIGFDLVKDRAVLEAAYDDAEGVTALFNLNVLNVLNRELDADFRLEDFRHRAVYDAGERRIEMSLVARRDLRVRLAALDLEIEFRAGEAVGTELSHKYTRGSATGLLRDAGLEVERWDTDAEARFAVCLTRPA